MSDGSNVPTVQGPVKGVARKSAAPAVALLRPIAPIAEVMDVAKSVREYVVKALDEGLDYGPIPGTSKIRRDPVTGKVVKLNGQVQYDQENTLLKPGAEKCANAFGLVISYHIELAEVDHFVTVQWTKRKKGKWIAARSEHAPDEVTNGVSVGLYRYIIRCELREAGTGILRGSALGSCSSLESKYVDRPRDVENTIVKQGEKRALVAVVLNTLGLSGMFTQDLDDDPDVTVEAEVRQQAKEERMGARPKALETVADALAVKVMGQQGELNPYGGRPLAEVPVKYLRSVLIPHYGKKVQETAERMGEDRVDPFVVQALQASKMVADHLELQARADAELDSGEASRMRPNEPDDRI